ncbi:MAG: hypothetical protein K2X35_25795, partial [Bryobacteraceae bacterium]|nr:hypothetical protein [Bryobacteraceae bacterium]
MAPSATITRPAIRSRNSLAREADGGDAVGLPIANFFIITALAVHPEGFCRRPYVRRPPGCAIMSGGESYGMAKVCQVTGKKPVSGNRVSH